MTKKSARAERPGSKSARRTKRTRNAPKKRIERAKTYLTESHPELTAPASNTVP
jgi:hypothetical protein